MKFDEAVGRVEAVLADSEFPKRLGPLYTEALQLVLERAKEPRVYALEPGDRKVLVEMAKDYNLQRGEKTDPDWDAHWAAKADALTAALALQEPFTGDGSGLL